MISTGDPFNLHVVVVRSITVIGSSILSILQFESDEWLILTLLQIPYDFRSREVPFRQTVSLRPFFVLALRRSDGLHHEEYLVLA